jgi:phosphatidylinositol glycan class B
MVLWWVATAAAFDAAEPIGSSTIVLYGSGDATSATVTLDGAPLAIASTQSRTDPERTYLVLSEPLHAGNLVVSAGAKFERTLVSLSTTIGATPTHTIPPAIYGQAFAATDGYVQDHGVSVVRWGGNAVTTYNPFVQATNAGSDWYFENREGGSANLWIEDVMDAGAEALLTVPALDWVSKDKTSYSFSVATYGSQDGTDPWNSDAGNGLHNGNAIANDPTDAYTAWTSDDARTFVESLTTSPTFAAVDHELDIASSTHRDCHPDPMTYDELRDRWLEYARAIKDADDGIQLLGPTSCCWWFYWNSAAGGGDKSAHGNEDFLPWFLDEVADADASEGRRTLDHLDVHYYPEGVFNDDTSPATRAHRLRSTRSLWDPTYTDESWIGTDQWASTQPQPNEVMLVPRMRDLVDAHYPGTGIAITEWNWGALDDMSGGLAVADVLGIFGREGVDVATMWTTADEGSPASAAFLLYRQDRAFADGSLATTVSDADLLGVYAAVDDLGTTIVVVNKDPQNDAVIDVTGLPVGRATIRHFGGALAGTVVEDADVELADTLVVPAYAAVFLSVAGAGDTGGTDAGSGDDGGGGDVGSGADDSASETPADEKSEGGCGCGSHAPAGWGAIIAACLAIRRRK